MKWYTVQEVRELPKLEWAIEGIVHQQEICLLWGEENIGKTFLSLDWALCVATGRPWMGRPTKQMPVYYFYMEGIRGASDRITAWEQHNGIAAPENFLLTDEKPPNIMSEDSGLFETNILTGEPCFVVIDTLNMSITGSTNDDALAKVIMTSLRSWTKQGATIVLIHHSRKTGKDTSPDPMGSMVYRGDVDANFFLYEKQEMWELKCRKQRNAPKADLMHMERREVGGSVVFTSGRIIKAKVELA